MPPPSRVPQAARRATARAKLLDAAVACLAELGYAASTTTEIARRAGVSRGAQQHYFPTKGDLLAEAVEHAFMQRVHAFRTAVDGADVRSDPTGIAVDVVWSMFEEPAALAWVELVVAARTDADLRRKVFDVSERMRQAIEANFRALFPRATEDVVYPVAAKVSFAVFEGLLFQRLSGYDDAPGRTSAALAALKRMLDASLGAPRRRRG